MMVAECVELPVGAVLPDALLQQVLRRLDGLNSTITFMLT